MPQIRTLMSVAAVLMLACAGRAGAASLQEVGSFDQPIYVTSDPEEGNRLLVVEREGVVREVSDGGAVMFADIRSLVACCEGERGLASIAPAPDFHTSGLFYAAYSGTPAAGGEEGDMHVDAFRRGVRGALVREPILTVPHSLYSNHNGGQLQFGPDGYLYIGLGDGGDQDDPFNSGQNLDTMLGKLLRIEPRPGQSPAYSIPAGNPFVGREGLDEIWAYGLRNPWRFSFDRAGGDLVIGDVGQGLREEIDYAPAPSPGTAGGAGANYGWDCREGLIAHTVDPSPLCEGETGFTEPVFDYPHEVSEDGSAWGCAIVGGYVVRDPALGALDGRYLYGDWCSGQLRSIELGSADPRETDRAEPGLSVPPFTLYSLGEDSCGRIYLVDGGGPVYRIVGDQPSSCPSGEPEEPPSDHGQPVLPSAGRIYLRALRRRGRVVGIRARITPCDGFAGRRLLLVRGGRLYASKKVGRSCLVRFRVRFRGRATFRAVVPRPGASRSQRLRATPLARSKRLVVNQP